MQVPAHTIHYLEIVTPEVAAVRELYTQLHGWRFTLEPALGNAFVAELPNGSRCGIRAPLRDTDGRAFWERAVQLTAFGQDVVRARADAVTANGIDRWIGGTRCTRSRYWRWNARTRHTELFPRG